MILAAPAAALRAGPRRVGAGCPFFSSRLRCGSLEPQDPGVHDHLPDSRQSLLGLTAEGDEAWLIRGISQKLYTCPGCYGGVEIGEDHVIVQYVLRIGGTEHRHWHRGCAQRTPRPRAATAEAGQRPRVGAREARGPRQAAGGQAGPAAHALGARSRALADLVERRVQLSCAEGALDAGRDLAVGVDHEEPGLRRQVEVRRPARAGRCSAGLLSS